MTTQLFAQTELVLSKSFVKELKEHAVLTSDLKVLKVTPEYGVQDDGDIHVYGQDTVIGLNVVAEVMNAGEEAQKAAGKLFKNASKEDEVLRVQGVWRIWCEHGRKGIHKQGVTKSPEDLDHVFELHPVTHVDNIDLTGSFITNEEVNSYTEASKAFRHYNKLKCKLKVSSDSIYITLTKSLFNYAKFMIDVPAKVEEHGDFISWYGDVRDSTGTKLPGYDVRMIAVKGTRCYTELLGASKEKMITVIAEPRLNLELISMLANAQQKPSEYISYDLPYEMVITAISK
jgi:hypothetical protein